MGEFSFICKKSGKAVASGDAVRMFLLKKGKVIEEMGGKYSNYGTVEKDAVGKTFEWKMDWNDVCDLMFSGNKGDGIAVILERYYKEGEAPPTEQSDDDPNQGWGKSNNGNAKIKEPYHKIY